MGNRIQLTQAIDNEPKMGHDGYTDKIVKDIQAVPNGSDLEVEIDCVGGNVGGGFRIARAISEHVGNTKAIVTGMAASMAGLLLAFFDTVEVDKYADGVMLHKAHIVGSEEKDLTAEEKSSIKTFNQKAYDKLKSKGVDESRLHDIFLSDKIEDFYFTPKQTKEIGLADDVTEVVRSGGNPIIRKLAALQRSTIRNKYESHKLKQMSLFGKKKPIVSRAEILRDDRVIIFNSVNETIAKGDKLSLLNSGESLKGNLILKSGLVAIVNEENVVESIEEVSVSDEISPEIQSMLEELAAAISALIERMEALEAGKVEAKEIDTPEGKKTYYSAI